MSFSDSFVWGVATAAYQIEGAAFEGGRKPSVWDMMCRKPGAVFDGHTGDVACDHYHRYKEDIQLMKELGVKGYRFSIAWPRVMPDGTGKVNAEGLDFYNRLVDGLLEAGIQPWATLFHWDTPLELYHRGGWMNPDSPKWFGDYATVVADALGDRVQNWMTLNEPQCFIGLGMHTGIHAPGDKLRWDEVLLAMHHSLLAHGQAVMAVRAAAKTPVKLGMAPTCAVDVPISDKPEDIEAARAAMFSVTTESGFQAGWWLDPVFLGHYPKDGLELFDSKVPKYTDEDMKIISQPLDFFGINIYHGRYVQAGPDGKAVEVARPTGSSITAVKWPVVPESLYWGPRFFYERYKRPIVVTENGLSNQDWESLDGQVHDPQRIDFLNRYLLQMKKAMADGVPVEGYFQWSLMDNFEWAEGYKERFGLIYVDYQTQKRTPKDSYHWYQKLIQSNGGTL